MTKLEREVYAIERAQQQALFRLAVRVRAEVLVPACQKHGLEFVAGNGTWCLSVSADVDPMRSMLVDAEDAGRKGYKLRRLFAALQTRVGDWPRGSVTPGGPELGMYMQDYKP